MWIFSLQKVISCNVLSVSQLCVGSPVVVVYFVAARIFLVAEMSVFFISFTEEIFQIVPSSDRYEMS